MREEWQQWLKHHTRWRRYACGECQHRGWTRQPLPLSDHPEEQELRSAAPQVPSRPLEARDRRERRASRIRISKAALLAIGLGSLIALLIGLISRK
jgi:hypothetical protein